MEDKTGGVNTQRGISAVACGHQVHLAHVTHLLSFTKPSKMGEFIGSIYRENDGEKLFLVCTELENYVLITEGFSYFVEFNFDALII